MPGQHFDDSPFTVGKDKVVAIGAMCDEVSADSVDEGDIGIPRMTADRLLKVSVANGATAAAYVQPGTSASFAVTNAALGTGPTVDSYNTVAVNLAASTADQVLVAAPAAGKQIWVYGLFMMADTAAGTVTLQDDADLALSGTMAVSDEGGWVLPLSGNFAMPWIKCTTAKALECDTGAATIDGILCYAVITV
jgi:hypothetical protein